MNNSNGATFTKDVLEHMMTDEKGRHQEALHVLNEYSDSAYRSAFSSGKIGGIAKKCIPYLEPLVFEKYIESSVSGGTVEDLCLCFKDEIPDINEKNVFKEISLLLKKVLMEAASRQRKERATPDVDVINRYYKKILKNSLVKTFLQPNVPSKLSDIYVRSYIEFDSKQIDPVNVDVLEKLNKHIIIQGTAGLGKTMLMKHLLLSAINETSSKKKIPVMINKLNNYKGENILEYVLQSFRRIVDDISLDNINNWLNDKKLLLLIDGIDEIKPDYTLKFNEELESFSEKYDDTTIIMTSRPIEDFLHFSSFIRADLCPLNKEQAIELIKRQTWNSKEKEQFILELDSDKCSLYVAHREFASVPLLLMVMLMAYSIDRGVIHNYVSFYKVIYKTLTTRHNQAKNVNKELSTGLSYNDFENYFADFCRITYWDGVYEFDQITIERYIKKLLGENRTFTADSFITDLTNNIGLMYKEGDYFSFIHRSIQEYYAALSFSFLPDNDFSVLLDFYKTRRAIFQDNSFYILYELVPDKVEQLILYPFLEGIMNAKNTPYYEYIKNIYDCIWCCDDIFFYAEQSVFGLCVTKILHEKYSFKNFEDDTPSEFIKKMIRIELLGGPKYPSDDNDPYHTVMTPIEAVLKFPFWYKYLRGYMESKQCSIYKEFLCVSDFLEKIRIRKNSNMILSGR